MKTTINWKSRTVWTGLIMMALGAAKLFIPGYIDIGMDTPTMISGGLALVFLKS